jgi:hypothetical protein
MEVAMKGLALAIPLLVGLAPQGTKAAPLDLADLWAEGGHGDHGATREYYNAPAYLRWRKQMGDWLDADGKPYGDAPFAESEVGNDAKSEMVSWDVTKLVQRWVEGSLPNKGFFLRCLAGGGSLRFRSREHADAAQHPQLVVDGRTLAPDADTYLDRSTYQGLGGRDTLNLSSENPVLLRFSLEGIAGTVKSATLKLSVAGRSGAPSRAGVFLCDSGLKSAPSAAPPVGLAARYPNDRGLEKDPAVYLYSDFEKDDWGRAWSSGADAKTLVPVSEDPERRLELLQGRALRVEIPKGTNNGMNVLYKFAKQTGSEPEEVYLRYYLRFSGDWQTIQGGKLPGIAGTYGDAGWGGRKVDGTDGWSARGSFNVQPAPGNPLSGRIPVGSYVYHADMPGDYGDIWIWVDGYGGLLAKDRWYCLEQYVKLNTPGQKDGVLRAWVDGRLAFEKTDVRYRKVDKLKIETVWMNIYHGGKLPTDRDVHAYVDNVVIARQYIGPMAKSR